MWVTSTFEWDDDFPFFTEDENSESYSEEYYADYGTFSSSIRRYIERGQGPRHVESQIALFPFLVGHPDGGGHYYNSEEGITKRNFLKQLISLKFSCL